LQAATVGKTQTTKGIWVSKNNQGDMLIFDIEGADSAQRAEQDRKKFERTTALYALAMADVLMVNIWCKSIGQFHGASMELLKAIFEVNFKLFGDKTKKKILVVIRDFNKDHDNFANNVSKLRTGFQQIWDECDKPDKFKDSEAKDFFKFDFVTLPNKTQKRNDADWNKSIGDMRARFELSHEKTFFITDHESKKVPIDGLNQMMQDTWQVIVDDKDLNLPDQRVMAAEVRCKEIKDESLAQIDSQIKTLQQSCNNKENENFKSDVETVMKAALLHYEKNARQYDPTVYKVYQKEIISQILNNLFPSYNYQVQILKQDAYQKVDKETFAILSKPVMDIA
jgi:protein SEY1